MPGVKPGSGSGAAVPAAASVLVHVNPIDPGVPDVLGALGDIAAMLEPGDDVGPEVGQPVEIPVRYGGEDGPDLPDVAARMGLSPSDVIERHASATYRVLFLGFAPGFGYLGPLAPSLVLPRRATPRVRVPAGSVAIGGTDTPGYSREKPRGLHLISPFHAPAWGTSP